MAARSPGDWGDTRALCFPYAVDCGGPQPSWRLGRVCGRQFSVDWGGGEMVSR